MLLAIASTSCLQLPALDDLEISRCHRGLAMIGTVYGRKARFDMGHVDHMACDWLEEESATIAMQSEHDFLCVWCPNNNWLSAMCYRSLPRW